MQCHRNSVLCLVLCCQHVIYSVCVDVPVYTGMEGRGIEMKLIRTDYGDAAYTTKLLLKNFDLLFYFSNRVHEKIKKLKYSRFLLARDEPIVSISLVYISVFTAFLSSAIIVLRQLFKSLTVKITKLKYENSTTMKTVATREVEWSHACV